MHRLLIFFMASLAWGQFPPPTNFKFVGENKAAFLTWTPPGYTTLKHDDGTWEANFGFFGSAELAVRFDLPNNSATSVDSVYLNFVALSGNNNLSYKVGIWSMNSTTGLPEKRLYLSSHSITKRSSKASPDNWTEIALSSSPAVQSSFFVVVYQLSSVRLGLASDSTGPPKKYYVSGKNESNWLFMTQGGAELMVRPMVRAVVRGGSNFSPENPKTAKLQALTGYSLERRFGSAGTWASYAQLGSKVLEYRDTSIMCSNYYYYRLKAVYSNGNSAYTSNLGGQLNCWPVLKFSNSYPYFGVVDVGDSVEVKLSLGNQGKDNFRISKVVYTAYTSGFGFHVQEDFSGSIVYPGHSLPVTIVFQPDSALLYQGILSFEASYPGNFQGPQLALVGQGRASSGNPEIQIIRPQDFSVLVFPNPMNPSGWLEIRGASTRGAIVQLIDVSGRILEIHRKSGEQKHFSLGPVLISKPSGVYLIRVQIGHQSATTKFLLLK